MACKHAGMTTVFDQRASNERQDKITLRRLDEIVPRLMDEHDIDSWILTSREYADDPTAMTMLPAEWSSSRRRTILVFIRSERVVERLSVARYDTNGLFPIAWDPKEEPDQWRALAKILDRHQPRTIAINTSLDFAHGDGLTESEHKVMVDGLGPDLSSRFVSADPLSINWLETRLPEERSTMKAGCAAAHSLLRRALSAEAITPGRTTTEDLVWWLRERVQELGTVTWFQPTVSVQRSGGDLRGSFSGRPAPMIIEPGDLVHIDFGIVWDGLCTDQQQHGYVLGDGESSVPDWLNNAIKTGNRMQDILMSEFEVGLTGNEVLTAALSGASNEEISARVYTHPIGFHGHGAGPTIGLWDQQGGVPGGGDRKLRADTAWSIELMVEVDSAEWEDRTVRIMLEEDAWFDGTGVEFLDGRQTGVWPIS